jgi:putative peptide maturation dehydrogenase
MLRSRRSAYLLFHVHDELYLDVEAMLRGDARVAAEPQLFALSILRGEEVPVTRRELAAALEFPADDWTDVGPEQAEEVEALARKGLLVVEGSGDPGLDELRRREESLAANEWNLYAAAYHFMTRWRGVDVTADTGSEDEGDRVVPEISAAMIERFVERYGPPPDTFHERAASRDALQLPLGDRDGGLYATLLGRRTTRAFEPGAVVELDEFATVMRYVFGCHGTAPFVGEQFGIKRTSPSGGGLHPVEAYPLVSGVQGVEPGLYHYRVRDHALELVRPFPADEASAAATRFVSGQFYLGPAQVSVILTARYYRNFWKYRRHQKAYAAILMDAAHLSQTLYLVAADLGLGAYATCAINSAEIDDLLGLDPTSEGAIAVVGFGKRAPGRSPREPRFRAYRPPR